MTQTPDNPPGGYHDETPSSPGMVAPVITGVIAAAIGPLIWVGCFKWFGYAYIGAVLIGLGIGLAIKFAAKAPNRNLSLAAAVLTILSSMTGYIWVEQSFIQWNPGFQPSVVGSIGHFFRDISAILFAAIGAYIAISIAATSRSRTE